jgi:hypothetical protein
MMMLIYLIPRRNKHIFEFIVGMCGVHGMKIHRSSHRELEN